MYPRSIRTIGAAVALGATLLPVSSALAQAYLGEIRCFGFNFAPSGWLALEGQLLPIASNTALFSLLGTTYGGDGRATFALPDMRGRSLVDAGMGAGLSPVNNGDRGGAETVTLLVSQLPAHSHFVTPMANAGDATSVSAAGMAPATKARTTLYAAGGSSATVAMSSTQTSNTGTNSPVPTRSPYIGVTCAIAVVGIYPSRS